MDPWCTASTGGFEVHNSAAQSNQTNSFQDSFLENDGKYTPLQDSAEYIELLEAKLRNISKSGNKKVQHREQVITNLLRSDSKQILGILSDTDIALERELDRNQVLSRIIPKQPITVGETVHLINADILDQNYSTNVDSDETSRDKVKKSMDSL